MARPSNRVRAVLLKALEGERGRFFLLPAATKSTSTSRLDIVWSFFPFSCLHVRRKGFIYCVRAKRSLLVTDRNGRSPFYYFISSLVTEARESPKNNAADVVAPPAQHQDRGRLNPFPFPRKASFRREE